MKNLIPHYLTRCGGWYCEVTQAAGAYLIVFNALIWPITAVQLVDFYNEPCRLRSDPLQTPWGCKSEISSHTIVDLSSELLCSPFICHPTVQRRLRLGVTADQSSAVSVSVRASSRSTSTLTQADSCLACSSLTAPGQMFPGRDPSSLCLCSRGVDVIRKLW